MLETALLVFESVVLTADFLQFGVLAFCVLELGRILCLCVCKVVLCGAIRCLGFLGVGLSGVGGRDLLVVKGEFGAEHGHYLLILDRGKLGT